MIRCWGVSNNTPHHHVRKAPELPAPSTDHVEDDFYCLTLSKTASSAPVFDDKYKFNLKFSFREIRTLI